MDINIETSNAFEVDEDTDHSSPDRETGAKEASVMKHTDQRKRR